MASQYLTEPSQSLSKLLSNAASCGILKVSQMEFGLRIYTVSHKVALFSTTSSPRKQPFHGPNSMERQTCLKPNSPMKCIFLRMNLKKNCFEHAYLHNKTSHIRQ